MQIMSQPCSTSPKSVRGIKQLGSKQPCSEANRNHICHCVKDSCTVYGGCILH